MKLERILRQDQRTIERYFRYRSHIAAGGLARFVMRRVLPFRELKKRRALASAIRTVAKSLSKHADGMYETNRVLLNVSRFFCWRSKTFNL